jgi:CO/xanthine dehydrogenase Mo-binding subunit
MVVGGVVARAARELTRRVLEWAQTRQGCELELERGRVLGGKETDRAFVDLARDYLEVEGPLEVTLHNEPPAWQKFDETTYQGSAYPTYSWGADVLEIEVDPDILEVRPVRVTVVNEVGKVLHEILCRGQVEGGTLQAIGYALYEDMQLDEGRYLNDRLATYIIPTFMDGPDMDVHLLERPWEGEPFGAKGVGELPMDGAAPAVCAALENAMGIVSTRIPATPERLYEWDHQNQRVESLAARRRSP